MKYLKELFAELGKRSIVTEMDFFCCDTCAQSDLKETYGYGKDVPIKGYCYFHSQQTESSVKTGKLMLSFGSFRDQSEDETIGIMIYKFFRDNGCEVEWNLSSKTKIKLTLTTPMIKELECLNCDASDKSDDESDDESSKEECCD